MPKLEGPFTYPSGWTGYYDPEEGRYLGMDDIFLPRDFDPHNPWRNPNENGKDEA